MCSACILDRKVSSGFTDAARRAGIRLAASATNPSSAALPTNETGSSAGMPYRKPVSSCAPAAAIASLTR